MLIEEQRQKDQEESPDAAFPIPMTPSSSEEKKIVIEPKTYCTLGHFNLLLEDYDKGMRIINRNRMPYYVTLQIIFVLYNYSFIRVSKILRSITWGPLQGSHASLRFGNVLLSL